MSEHRSYYSVKYNYCPVCYHQTIISSARGSKNILFFLIPFLSIFIIFGVVFVLDILSTFSDSSFGPPPILIILFGIAFTSIPLFVIIVASYNAFVTSPIKAKESEIKLQQFLDEIGMSDKIVYEEPAYYKNSFKKLQGTRYCNQCGSTLNPGDHFCNVCGDTTKDEGF